MAASDSVLSDESLAHCAGRLDAGAGPHEMDDNVPAHGWKSGGGQANDAGHRDTVLPHLTVIQPITWRR
jgi:hypothetical protein